jgi:predicted RNA-binding Zn-ribbon protein involved in translation (DUF1610 family)
MRLLKASLSSRLLSSRKRASETAEVHRTRFYKIDLTKVEGSGDVKCPKCGTEISPDDTSDEVYTILEPVIKEDHLEEIVLQCNTCRSTIHLVGFNEKSQQD